MSKVAITDYSFADLDPEKRILEPLGCTLVDQKEFVGEEKLQELVQDADYVITQFAPLNQDFHFGPGTVKVYTRAAPNTTSFRAEPCT